MTQLKVADKLLRAAVGFSRIEPKSSPFYAAKTSDAKSVCQCGLDAVAWRELLHHLAFCLSHNL